MRRELDEVRHLLNDPERLGSSAGYFVQLLAGVGWSSLPAVLSGADSFTGSPDDAREA